MLTPRALSAIFFSASKSALASRKVAGFIFQFATMSGFEAMVHRFYHGGCSAVVPPERHAYSIAIESAPLGADAPVRGLSGGTTALAFVGGHPSRHGVHGHTAV